ncbi:MAG: nuclear transport factor 2 family protein [Massilia sp.]
MQDAVEALTQFYAAVNRQDSEAIGAQFAPHIVRIEPPGFPTAGTYRGAAEVSAHVQRGRATWAEGKCETEGFFVKDDKVVVYLYAWVRLHGASEWMGGRFADGFVFRHGLITEYYSFGERAEALAWAGLSEAEVQM